MSISFYAFADSAKFIILDKNGNPIKNSDYRWHDLYFEDTKGCFVGATEELVADINAGYYNEGDDVLYDAKIVNENSISFFFGGLPPEKQLFISHCNF